MQVALTEKAEDAIGEAVRTGRDGDALYFWAQIDRQAGNASRGSPMQPSRDFWTDCDSSNNGQCRYLDLINNLLYWFHK